MPPGSHRLIAAQFFSALADNALLIVTMALLALLALPAGAAAAGRFVALHDARRMLGFSVALGLVLSIVPPVIGFGLLIALAIGVLTWRSRVSLD